MSTIKLTTNPPASQSLRIRDMEDGDFFLRRSGGVGWIGLRVWDHVVFFYRGDPPCLVRLSAFRNEVIERRIDSVEIIER